MKISLLSPRHSILQLQRFLCKYDKYKRLLPQLTSERFVVASTNCNEILGEGTRRVQLLLWRDQLLMEETPVSSMRRESDKCDEICVSVCIQKFSVQILCQEIAKKGGKVLFILTCTFWNDARPRSTWSASSTADCSEPCWRSGHRRPDRAGRARSSPVPADAGVSASPASPRGVSYTSPWRGIAFRLFASNRTTWTSSRPSRYQPTYVRTWRSAADVPWYQRVSGRISQSDLLFEDDDLRTGHLDHAWRTVAIFLSWHAVATLVSLYVDARSAIAQVGLTNSLCSIAR